MYRVIQTDCRTGWLVVDGANRPTSGVYRRRETAQAEADLRNGKGAHDAA